MCMALALWCSGRGCLEHFSRCGDCHWFQMPMIPQAFNPPGEPIDRARPPPFVTIIGPEFTVSCMAGEPVKDTPQNGVRHGHGGSLLPTADGEALIEGRKRRVLGPHSSMGELGQDRPEGDCLCGFCPSVACPHLHHS